MATQTPQITLTGTLLDSGNNPVQGKVELTLANIGSSIPRITGTGIIAPLTYVALCNSSGVWTLVFWGNFQITPPGTFYALGIFKNQSATAPDSISNYAFNTAGTFDFSEINPLSEPPVPFTYLDAVITDPTGVQTIAFYPLNAAGGFLANNLNPTVGHVLRSNGTAFVDAQLQFSDIGGVAVAGQVPPLQSLNGAVTPTQVPPLQNLLGAVTAGQEPSTTVNAVTNDTNITGSISAQNLTLGWAGTLVAGRLNSNVVQSVTNDTNVTGSISGQNLTLGWTGVLSVARGGSGTGSAPVIVGGQNIAITGAFPSQTISFSGILPIANGGNGSATPGIQQGTGTTVTGTWPNQTITATSFTAVGSLTAVQNLDVSTFAGADLGAKINSAIASAPAAGCVLDLRNFASPQTLSTAVNLNGPYKLLAAGMVVNQSAAITLSGNNSGIVGVQGRAFQLVKAASLAEQVVISGNDCVLDNIVLNGEISLSYTGSGVVISSGAARTIISNSSINSQTSYGIQNQGSTDALVSGCYFNANGVHAYYESAVAARTRFQSCEFVDASTSTGATIYPYTGSTYMDDVSVISSSANIAFDASAGATVSMVNCVLSQSGGYSAYKHGANSFITQCQISGGGTSGAVVQASGGNFQLVSSTVTGTGVSDGLLLTNPDTGHIVRGNYIVQNFTSSGKAAIHVNGEILGVIVEGNSILMGSVTATNYGIWCQYSGSDHFSGMHISGNSINAQNGTNAVGIYWDNTNGSTNSVGNLMDGNFGIDIENGIFIQVYDAFGYLEGIIQDNKSYGGALVTNGNPDGIIWNQPEDDFTLATAPIAASYTILNLEEVTPTNPVRSATSGTGGPAVLLSGSYRSLVNPTVAQYNNTNVTGFISYEYIYTTQAAGQYLLNWNATLWAAGASSSMGPLYISYVDQQTNTTRSIQYCPAYLLPASGTVTTPVFATSSNANAVGTGLLGIPLFLNCAAGEPIGIEFFMSGTVEPGSPPVTPACSLNIVVEIR
jgi:hypothetical protein